MSAGKLRSRMWIVSKWILCGVVLAFVLRRGWQLWNQPELSQIEFRAAWLVPAGLIYLAAWLPSIWFWRRSMQRLGCRVSLRNAAVAYYPGHLGKYVPGKALVLVIRSGLLRPCGVPLSVSAFAAALETLLMMGAGLALGLALMPALFPQEVAAGWPAWARHVMATPLLPAGIVVVGVLAVLLLLSELLMVLAARMLPGRGLSGYDTIIELDASLLAGGVAAMLGGWLLIGLSLGFVLLAVGTPWDLRAVPIWTGTAALATSIGFAAIFAPGGLGVREGLLIEILSRQPEIGPQQAVAAAVLLRAVWFVAEIAAGGGLYWVHAVHHRSRAE